jgi:hypothetical protein
MNQRFLGHNPARVIRGPFAGMQYVSRAVGSSFIPKILGTYEQELHPTVTAMATKDYDTVIDVGCAEGYYAIGMARLLPRARVFAFDTSRTARRLCGEMARLNSVEARVQIGSFCDLARLSQSMGPRTLIICDCEGYEMELLDPIGCPALANADVLVELHEFKSTEIGAVPGRFAATHEVAYIKSESRQPEGYDELNCLEVVQRSNAISEFRPPGQRWAVMYAKH